MFDKIVSDSRLVPRVTIMLILIWIFTAGVLWLEPNFVKVWGVYHTYGVPLKSRLTIPFIHGYDHYTMIIHLVINILCLFFIGGLIEKIIGSYRFLLVLAVTSLVYLLIHRLFLMIGHSGAPIVMALSGFSVIVMIETRFVKTSSRFDDYYKFLAIFLIVTVIGNFILLNVFPIYFNTAYTSGEAMLHTSLLLVSSLLVGVFMGIAFKGHIRTQLVDYTRKKRIKHTVIDDRIWMLTFLIPVYLVVLFFI